MKLAGWFIVLICCCACYFSPCSAAAVEEGELDTSNCKSPKITVWVRAGGSAVKSEISTFIQNTLKSLPQGIDPQILVCTNENDTILEELDTITKTEKTVKVIFSHLSSYSSSLTALARHTDSDSSVLSLSVGIAIRTGQIREGLSSLNGRVRAYGWAIKEHGNDGSVPGKGWYHTAALLDKTVVKLLQEEGIPHWVDNGVLGTVGEHTIGGNEEIPLMVRILQLEPDAKFVLNVSDPVSTSLQVGTGVRFQEKIARKGVVSLFYMHKLHQESAVTEEFEDWAKQIWKSLEVI